MAGQKDSQKGAPERRDRMESETGEPRRRRARGELEAKNREDSQREKMIAIPGSWILQVYTVPPK